jgi:hypothetical protein
MHFPSQTQSGFTFSYGVPSSGHHHLQPYQQDSYHPHQHQGYEQFEQYPLQPIAGPSTAPSAYFHSYPHYPAAAMAYSAPTWTPSESWGMHPYSNANMHTNTKTNMNVNMNMGYALGANLIPAFPTLTHHGAALPQWPHQRRHLSPLAISDANQVPDLSCEYAFSILNVYVGRFSHDSMFLCIHVSMFHFEPGCTPLAYPDPTSVRPSLHIFCFATPSRICDSRHHGMFTNPSPSSVPTSPTDSNSASSSSSSGSSSALCTPLQHPVRPLPVPVIACNVPLLAPKPLPYHPPHFLQFEDLPEVNADLSHPPYAKRTRGLKRPRDDEDEDEEGYNGSFGAGAGAGATIAVDGCGPPAQKRMALAPATYHHIQPRYRGPRK